MSVIIKSNQKATKSLGDIFGLRGPSDYSLILDFNQQVYLKKGVGGKRLNLNEVINFTRSSKGTYLDETNTLRTAEVNEPRIHYNPISGKKGLLLETGHTQLLANPHAPTSQTINLTHSTSDRLILSCKGTGRVSLNGNVSLVSGSPAFASENNPAMYQTTATGAVNVVVEGALEVFGLYFVNSIGGSNVRMFTPQGLSSVSADICKLSPTLFSEILSGKANYTIMLNVREFKRPAPGSYTSRHNVFALLESSSGNKGVYVYRRTGSSPRSQTAFLDDSGTTVKSTLKSVDDTIYNHTHVLSVGNAGANAIVGRNGEVEIVNEAYSINPTEMVLGSTVPWLSNSYLNGIITSLVIYPYKMTYEQVQELSKTFN